MVVLSDLAERRETWVIGDHDWDPRVGIRIESFLCEHRMSGKRAYGTFLIDPRTLCTVASGNKVLFWAVSML